MVALNDDIVNFLYYDRCFLLPEDSRPLTRTWCGLVFVWVAVAVAWLASVRDT